MFASLALEEEMEEPVPQEVIGLYHLKAGAQDVLVFLGLLVKM